MRKRKPRNHKRSMIHLVYSMILILLTTVAIPSQASSSPKGIAQDEATQLIHKTAHATEQAWEEFHAAAIQGTLASPLTQVTIEGQLHKARRLLMQARLAKRSQEYQVVKEITEQIKEITQNIIQASRERKQ